MRRNVNIPSEKKEREERKKNKTQHLFSLPHSVSRHVLSRHWLRSPADVPSVHACPPLSSTSPLTCPPPPSNTPFCPLCCTLNNSIDLFFPRTQFPMMHKRHMITLLTALPTTAHSKSPQPIPPSNPSTPPWKLPIVGTTACS